MTPEVLEERADARAEASRDALNDRIAEYNDIHPDEPARYV